MFDEERPCLLKYWKEKYISLTVKSALPFILFVLQIIADQILCDRIRYFYFIAVVLASTATALHLKIMHNPEPKLDNKSQIDVSICHQPARQLCQLSLAKTCN